MGSPFAVGDNSVNGRDVSLHDQLEKGKYVDNKNRNDTAVLSIRGGDNAPPHSPTGPKSAQNCASSSDLATSGWPKIRVHEARHVCAFDASRFQESKPWSRLPKGKTLVKDRGKLLLS